MGQRILLAGAALLLVGSVALGVLGAQPGWSPVATAGGLRGGHALGGEMMRGPGGGMMGGSGPGGMMGRASAAGPAISIDQAQQSVERYLTGSGGSDLAVDELIEFQDNFYAVVKEKSTGTGAFEVLVDRVTGTVTPEPGPNMMWNTKYGMGGRGMMGSFAGRSGSMTVSLERAGQIAQGWLDANQAGAEIETPDTFPGYYTVHFTRGGKVAGMLSVNGSTGEVWYHSWHGAFIQEREV